MGDSVEIGPYSQAALTYRSAGWVGVLPLPAMAKKPVPVGYTGYKGVDPSGADVQEWIEQMGGGNIALRLPDGVLGIDVDAYDGKHGARSLEQCEGRWGKLPPTWQSGSRDDGVSGIRLYRVPTGLSWTEKPAGPGIELLRHDHRWVCVWPSWNPDSDRQYIWLGPDGGRAVGVPRIQDLAWLPEPWVKGLSRAESEKSSLIAGSGDPFAPPAGKEWSPEQVQAECWKWLERLRAAQHGDGRNSILNDTAVRVGHFIPAYATEEQAHNALYAAAETCGHVQKHGSGQTHATIRSGLHRGMAEPYRVGARETSGEDGKNEGGEVNAVDGLWSEFLDSDGIDELPDPEPLIEGWLYRNSAGAIIGKSGDGKSFLVLDIAGAVGSGQEWHGAPTEKAEVWIIVAEGATGIRKRKKAWELHHGRRLEGVRVLPRPVQANGPEWSALVELAKREKPGLIFIDTQARVTVGMNENDNTEMGIYVECAERLRVASGACVKTVHHIGKNGDGGRGASSLYAAWTTELTVTKKKNSEGGYVLTVENTKNKDDAEHEPITLTLKVIELGQDSQGRGLTSCVLTADPFGPAPAAVHEEVALPESSARMVEIMRDVLGEGHGGTRAQATAVYMERWGQGKKSTAWRAWNHLVQIGALARVAGRDSYLFVPVDAREPYDE